MARYLAVVALLCAALSVFPHPALAIPLLPLAVICLAVAMLV